MSPFNYLRYIFAANPGKIPCKVTKKIPPPQIHPMHRMQCRVNKQVQNYFKGLKNFTHWWKFKYGFVAGVVRRLW